MERVTAASLILMAFYSTLRVLHIKTIYLIPFDSAITTFGSITSLLALLIFSSLFYRSSDKTYLLRQVPFFLLLVTLLFAGSVFSMVGMRNTAYTFTGMYIMEKFVEINLENQWNVWILMFSSSIVLYNVALYFHANPDFVVSMFSTL
eukprot:TRINITY_DN4393_c0_g1_i3.p1 TRINITY_DN4393_c0_g1~~TRINITY_DN4393_c0_g1_i3.p1  ORF type:complete len:148 (-),score=14.05 TRINITY_DN4393_c0_g1_i3:39-482(-)